MADIDALRVELADPKYANMTAEEAAASLNVMDCERHRASMSGSEIFEAIDATEWAALTDENKSQVLGLCGIGGLDPFGNAAMLLTNIFGSGATLTALGAARVETVSRATELRQGIVRPGHVEEARRG